MSGEKLNTVNHLDNPHAVYFKKLPDGSTQATEKRDVLHSMANFENYLPDLKGKKTWISNYVGTFWTHFMGPTAFAIYFQLVKMAYGDKDYSFPSVAYLADLIGASPSTIRRNMLTLIELEFVIAYEVKDARTGKNMSNLYFISNTDPFLPQEKYDQLPDKLKDEHDEFMEYIKTRTRMVGQAPEYEREQKSFTGRSKPQDKEERDE